MIMITTTIITDHDHHHHDHGHGLKHYHDEEMQSLSLRTDKPLDPAIFMPWLQNLVATEGQKILRSKGILAFAGDEDRYVFQGVHMMLEGDHQRKWKDRRAARKPSRLHWSRIAGAEDSRRLRALYRHVMSEFDPGGAPSIASMTDQVKPLPLGMRRGVSAIPRRYRLFRRYRGEGRCCVSDNGEISPIAVHGGAILCAASDGKRIVMGGDDGKVVALDAKGEVTVLATDAKRRWIDNVALHPDGAVAWSAGKTAFIRSAKGEEKSFDAPSTVGGLAFAPKGLRLAIAHYNGVTLWFPNMAAKPEFLEWAGSHLGVTFSPDNKFLVTAMHEPAMHGWRLADSRHMRMSGYPGRVRSMSWSAGGKGLATSGADSVIIWPFASKDGPMGKQPAMLAPLQARVSAVACHPKQDIMASGYSDGTVLMIRLEDGAEILLRREQGRSRFGAGLERQRHAAGVCRRGGDGGLLEF